MAVYHLPVTSGRVQGRGLRLTVLAATIVGAILLVGSSVYADLNATATNTSAQAISSGSLELTMTDAGAGFGQAVSNLVPGDVVHRFVTLSNSGTLDGTGLTLGVGAATASKLTTDATKGLQVRVDRCTAAWNTTAGTCAGTGSTLLASTALSSLIGSPQAFSGLTGLAAGDVLYLRITVSLPSQTETTVNGVLPASTIQGLSASLTWSFTEVQRAGTVTNS